MENDFIKVGQISKSFGVDGYCKVKFFDDFRQNAVSSKFLFINHDNYHVPYRVLLYKSNSKMILFADVTNQSQADKLQGLAVYLPYEEVAELIVTEKHPLIGFSITASDISIGKIIDIREMPHQILATVSHNEKELLIPIHQDLIIKLDEQSGIIEMDLPDGILDL